MNIHSATNAVTEEHLHMEETKHSCCGPELISIVGLAKATDGYCSAECVSGEWSDKAIQENLAAVKEEPGDVCKNC